MANTTNINLRKPEDGSQRWGVDLNNNFEIIDKEFNELQNLIKSGTSSSGLLERVNPNDFVVSGNTLTIPDLKYYFYVDGTSGIFNSMTYTFADAADPYKNYYFGIEYSNDSVSFCTTSAIEDIQSWINDNAHILLGSIALSGLELKGSTKVINPWFTDYGLSDRSINFHSKGNINGLEFKANNNYIELSSDDYYWEKEGINPYSSSNVFHIKHNFLTLNGNHVKFFRALANAQLDSSELELVETVDYKYANNNELTAINNGYYSIQRIAVIGNSNAVVFYGNEQYNNLLDLQNAIVNQPALNTFIRVKEVARMIVSNNTIIGIYNLNQLNDAVHLYSIGIDANKKQYIAADASEIRSNGIVPELNKITTSGISSLNVCRINNNAFDKSTIQYSNLTTNFVLPADADQWKYINLDNNNNVSFDIALDTNKINLGFLYKNTNYTNIQIMPEYCTTNPENRVKNRYGSMKVNGMCAYVTDEDKINIGNANIVNEVNVIFKEGVNYLNNSLNNYKLIGATTKIQFRYSNNLNTSAIDTIVRPSTGYNIQKLLVLADGSYIMIPGTVSYETKPTNIFSSEEGYQYHPYFATEIARFIVPSSGSIESYYTNSTINGNVQIHYASATSTQQLEATTLIGDVGFSGIGTISLSKDINLDGLSGTKGNEILPVYLDNGVITECNYKIEANVPSDAKFTDTTYGKVSYDVDGLMTSADYAMLHSVDASLKNLIRYGSSTPVSHSTGQWIYVNTTDHKVYVWDGIKWQLMNSWQ